MQFSALGLITEGSALVLNSKTGGQPYKTEGSKSLRNIGRALLGKAKGARRLWRYRPLFVFNRLNVFSGSQLTSGCIWSLWSHSLRSPSS